MLIILLYLQHYIVCLSIWNLLHSLSRILYIIENWYIEKSLTLLFIWSIRKKYKIKNRNSNCTLLLLKSLENWVAAAAVICCAHRIMYLRFRFCLCAWNSGAGDQLLCRLTCWSFIVYGAGRERIMCYELRRLLKKRYRRRRRRW